jgi:hypothetical protein
MVIVLSEVTHWTLLNLYAKSFGKSFLRKRLEIVKRSSVIHSNH